MHVPKKNYQCIFNSKVGFALIPSELVWGLSLFFLLFSLGCRHRSDSHSVLLTSKKEWKLGQEIATPKHITYIFSWTNDSAFEKNAIQALEKKLSDSRVRNQVRYPIDYRSAKAGAGIYGAADPFVSKSFGKFLLILPISEEKTLSALNTQMDDPRYLEIVKSQSAGVVYPWESYLLDSSGAPVGYAAVIRESSVLSLDLLKIVGPIEPDYSCKNLNEIEDLNSGWHESFESIPPDFYFCTVNIIQEHASFYHKPNMDLSNFLKSREDDLELFFAANIRYGSYLVESAGVKESEVKCGGSDFCALIFGRTISHKIQEKWEGKLLAVPDYEKLLPLSEAISAAKGYNLIPESAVPRSFDELQTLLNENLSVNKPELDKVIHSHIDFYNKFMGQLSKESILEWEADN